MTISTACASSRYPYACSYLRWNASAIAPDHARPDRSERRARNPGRGSACRARVGPRCRRLRQTSPSRLRRPTPGRRRRSARVRHSCRSTSAVRVTSLDPTASSSPRAEPPLAARGMTATVAPSARARRGPCAGPAPPVQTTACSRGSKPRLIETSRIACSMFQVATSWIPQEAWSRSTPSSAASRSIAASAAATSSDASSEHGWVVVAEQ